MKLLFEREDHIETELVSLYILCRILEGQIRGLPMSCQRVLLGFCKTTHAGLVQHRTSWRAPIKMERIGLVFRIYICDLHNSGNVDEMDQIVRSSIPSQIRCFN